jgi:rod shape-determining protein MreC
MDVLGRYRNLIVLVGVLFAQLLGLAVQVKRTSDSESTRLIRVWAVSAITPFEEALVWTQTSTGNLWHNYFYLRGVRAENRSLKAQIEQMRLEQVRMSQDADQARRLQALLAFKEQFISQTMAAQVIGGSGSELSRSIYIDKGYNDGVKTDMAVITSDGIVGKVLRVYRSTSLVLMIDDQTSGVGAILDKTRLQGILRGTASGEVVLEKVMSDETVSPGELVLTSGGDGIFPKGLLVGRVTKASQGSELFLNIRVRPAANLSKLEEVLVVTKIDERQAEPGQTGAARAVDILAQRLPGVPSKPSENAEKGAAGTAATEPGAATTGAQTSPDTDGKPKPVPPQGAAINPPVTQNTATAVSSAVAGSGTLSRPSSGSSPAARTTASDAAKVSPKSVKAVVVPKPQAAVQDSPH